MNYRDIKDKTNEVMAREDNLLKTFVYVAIITGILGFIGDIFQMSYLGSITIIVTILTCTVRHGYIVSSLKQANGREDTINPGSDSLVGFTRFSELFFTYFLLLIINFLIAFLGIFLLINIMMFTGLINEVKDLYSITAADVTLISFIVIWALAVLCIFIYVNCSVALAPFVLEKYGTGGIASIKESIRLMKGNKKTLIILLLSYILRFILAIILCAAVGLFCGMISLILPLIGTMIASLLVIIVFAYVFEMPVEVSIAVFYEKIDYDDKNNVVNATVVG